MLLSESFGFRFGTALLLGASTFLFLELGQQSHSTEVRASIFIRHPIIAALFPLLFRNIQRLVDVGDFAQVELCRREFFEGCFGFALELISRETSDFRLNLVFIGFVQNASILPLLLVTLLLVELLGTLFSRLFTLLGFALLLIGLLSTLSLLRTVVKVRRSLLSARVLLLVLLPHTLCSFRSLCKSSLSFFDDGKNLCPQFRIRMGDSNQTL